MVEGKSICLEPLAKTLISPLTQHTAYSTIDSRFTPEARWDLILGLVNPVFFCGFCPGDVLIFG